MFYLNMNAVLALIGMIAVLGLTRKWPHNKRILLLAFNLCFLLLFSGKLFFCFTPFIPWSTSYCFLFLCGTQSLRKLWFIAFIAANVLLVCLVRWFIMGLFASLILMQSSISDSFTTV